MRMFRSFALAVCALAAASAAAGEFLVVTPERIDWKLMRKEPPLHRAFIQGSQEAAGAFTFRVRATAGHKLLPHTHPDDRVITVLEGTYWSALGAEWDESKLMAFPAGSFYVVPAGMPHFSAVLEGETVFQESGIGPSRNDMIPQVAR
ncbi:MAG: cupin domain-containing protein [Betaproteobacteria bacterium]|jgi:quercetin dioxygenase-like cupin family protein|nr:cupin domain-containing protein [Rhodocyclaceae bacterium]MCA3140672.1 cupin domain-containing protein [Rhodocyclaceae bacterium]MCE2897824.1 cupin domain-containing protein [Betaproteobacteria bacterium]